MRHRKTKIHKGGGIRMKANINRVVSRLEDIYQCGKKEDGTYTRMEENFLHLGQSALA